MVLTLADLDGNMVRIITMVVFILRLVMIANVIVILMMLFIRTIILVLMLMMWVHITVFMIIARGRRLMLMLGILVLPVSLSAARLLIAVAIDAFVVIQMMRPGCTPTAGHDASSLQHVVLSLTVLAGNSANIAHVLVKINICVGLATLVHVTVKRRHCVEGTHRIIIYSTMRLWIQAVGAASVIVLGTVKLLLLLSRVCRLNGMGMTTTTVAVCVVYRCLQRSLLVIVTACSP